MIRRFTDAVKFLEEFIPTPEKKHPGKLGIERMKYFVALLGNPHDAYPTIHVGGTSGKGSTATLIAAILSTRYTVGLHTSPHLTKINERIKTMSNIKAQMSNDISDEKFVHLVNEIEPLVKQMEKSVYGTPSYFEIVTALAFLYFKQKKVDIAVIEVGMGGRFDATNVIKPDIAVLTNVGRDHTEILGDTVEKIATDKIGIIKQNMHVVTGVKQKSVEKIMKLKVKSEKSKVSILGKDFSYQVKKVDKKGSIFDYFGENTYRNLKLSLLGRHQVENAAIALRAIEISNSHPPAGGPIPNLGIRQGLLNAFIPGRFEIVKRNPYVILDGAHNEEKMKALVTAIKDIFPKKRITVLLAIKSDKNGEGILKELLPICQKIIFTKFRLTTDLGDTLSYDPSLLLEKARKIKSSLRLTCDMSIIENAKRALQKTQRQADIHDIIIVTGSLYLVGEVRKHFG